MEGIQDNGPKHVSSEDAWIVLNGIPHLGPITLRRLFDRFGPDPARILQAKSTELKTVEGVGGKIAESIVRWPNHFDLEREKRQLEKHQAEFIRQSDTAYPKILEEIYDPPIGLYALGSLRSFSPAIAIIGSRRTTLYGIRTAKAFAGSLARRGICIVSGLASGIDAAAHEGALEVGGETVAVLGNGADIVYPTENIHLFQSIKERGCILTEFPFGYRANRQSFPMRNRIVAGMSIGILVVETDISGGSLITARFAGDQGRQVFAIPGRIDQSTSAGCHQLIRDGATLVTSAEEIIEQLRLDELPMPTTLEIPDDGDPKLKTSSTPEETLIENCLADGEILHPDQIATSTGLETATVNATLMLLELRKVVRKRADGRFEKR
ncbi:MAG: DNA-processing protein DprA [Verrucomicrobiota bacterium]